MIRFSSDDLVGHGVWYGGCIFIFIFYFVVFWGRVLLQRRDSAGFEIQYRRVLFLVSGGSGGSGGRNKVADLFSMIQ